MTRFLQRLKTRYSTQGASDFPLYGAWAFSVIALETIGRRSPSDASDLGAVTVVLLVILLSAVRHSLRPIAAVGRCKRFLQRRLQPLLGPGIKRGLDFRGEPPLPRRLCPTTVRTTGSALIAVLVTLFLRHHLAGSWRSVLVWISPTVNAVYLILLWVTLGFLTVSAVVLPLLTLSQWRRRAAAGKPQSSLLIFLIGFLWSGLVVSFASLCPPVFGLAGLFLVAVALFPMLLLRHSRNLTLLWRRSEAGSPVFSTSCLSFEVFGHFSLCVAGAALTLLCTGDRLWMANLPDGTPLTSFFGRVFLWTWLATWTAYACWSWWFHLRGRRGDPSMPVRPLVHLLGPLSHVAFKRCASILKREGLRVTHQPGKGEDLAVPLELGVEARRASFDDPRWFRVATEDELGQRDLMLSLRRRHVQMCRRAVRKGISRALKYARGQSFERGSGYWVAPHLWFVSHLTRDEDEDSNIFGTIGRPWSALIPLAARSEFYALLRRLQIDLIYVEDGVKPRGVVSVLNALFEHDDVKPDRPLSSLEPLRGIRGVHVILHEHDLGGHLGEKGYPEPDYDEVGRARILHLFKDRGGEDAPVEDPVEQGSRPVLSLVG